MATPKAGYILPSGGKVAGVTTIIGRFKESGGLMQWAFKCGQDGQKSLYEKSDVACDIGTAAHAMIEAHINGAEPTGAKEYTGLPQEQQTKAENAFGQYLKWAAQTNVELLSKYQEMQLVCPEMKFGGTPDAIGRIGNDIVLLDWKTSNAVYGDHLIQLAAYGYLIEHGVRMSDYKSTGLKITGGFHLLRFSKDHDDFEHRYFATLDDEWRMFVLYREAYELDKKLKGRVK